MSKVIFPRTKPDEIDPDEEDIEFQITDWYIPESDRSVDYYRRKEGYPKLEGDAPVYEIGMFGSTIDGHSVYVKVTDFQPYFFVKVPETWQEKGEKFMKKQISALEHTLKTARVKRTKINYETKKREEYISSIIPQRLIDHLVSVSLVHRKEFWGFTNGELFPFIRIKVKSLALFNILKRYFAEPAQVASGLKLYESNIDPFLRFIHQRNIKPCGWVRLPAGHYSLLENTSNDSSSDKSSDAGSGDVEAEPVTRCSYNFTVSHKNVYTEDINKIAPLLIASFDIECSSSHGDFPVAKKDYRKLATDLVAAVKEDPTRFTKENITYWIRDSFTKDTYVSPYITIARVYPLDKVNVNKHVVPIVDKYIDEIIRLIGLAANISYNEDDMIDSSDDEEIADDEGENEKAVSKRKTGGFSDNDGPLTDLVNYFTKIRLPKLAGDKVIQIGTTVTRFGSDEIIYKHIITLNTCDPITGADVESYDAEDEVIMAWKDLIKRLDPDIVTGYNIFGFDMKYIWERAEELGIDEHLCVGFGRINSRRTILDKKELSSSALGNNIMYFFDLDGVVTIDMYKVMQRDHKLDSYKLDHVANTFLGDKKDDISPAQIFSKFYGSSADRCEVAKYCVQDCALVNRLISKLKVLENNVGMGNVCSVPLSYLFMRGQGIKIFSLVSKESRNNDTLIPVIRNAFDDEKIDDEGYEGAIVLEPHEGMYLEDPIVVFDYNSLYPSSMISRNLSHDSYVADPNSKYAKMEDKGVTYQKVSYDVYEGKGDAKKVVGKRECIFAQFPDGKKGIIPMILQNLLNQRANTRKRMEYETLTLSDGRVAVGLVKELENGQLEILNVDKANIGEGFGGHKATIDASLVIDRKDTYDKFEQAVLDALQLAYKVTANSLYGQTGSRTSPIYLKEIAACTTATGREMIYLAKNFVEKNYDANVIYGDSVTGDTPLLVRNKEGVVSIKTIETLSDNWIEYENFRPWDTSLKDKEQTGFEGEVWANGKWAKIIRVIRHKVNKKLYRVNTYQGCVDVTEDHSLIGINGDKIKPSECVVNETDILHTYPSEFNKIDMLLPRYVKESSNVSDEQGSYICTKCKNTYEQSMYYYTKKGVRQKQCKLCIKNKACERHGLEFNGKINHKVLYYDIPRREIIPEEAWVMGFFFGDGSCGNYTGVQKQSWALNNQSLDYLNKALEYLSKVEPNNVVTFKILDTIKSSGVYKLVACGSIAYMVEKYRSLFYDKDKFKRVPDIIINSSQEVRKWFLDGYLAADGCKLEMKKDRLNFCCKGKIGSMGLYYIAKSVGYKNLRVNIRQDEKPNIYWIRTIVSDERFTKYGNKIMKMHELPPVEEGVYVYDIETSEGKFGCGVGSITVSNTDSIFVKFPLKDSNGNHVKGREALPIAIELGQKVEKAIKAIMPNAQNLAYEKTLWPFIQLSKKRYVGNLYEKDVNKFKEKSMGIVLKRRDNAPIVKTVYRGIINILLNKGDFLGSVQFLQSKLEEIVTGSVNLEELIISKTLNASYKNPSKIAHKVLATRMGERDAGNKPQANDRIPFVFIKTPEGVEIKLQGDRIEHPDYIRSEGLTPDYYYYITNQLIKPISQLYALCVDKLPGYTYPPSYWEQMDIEMSDTKIYTNDKKRKKRIQALKQKEVVELLFAKYLDILKPDRNVRVYKKRHVLDLDKNEKADPSKINYELIITCDKLKQDKNAKEKVKGQLWETTITIKNTTANTEIFTGKLVVNNKKHQAYVRAAEHGFKLIYDSHKYIIDEGKLCVKTDSSFITKWKSAYKNIHTLQERLQEIINHCDAGLLDEIQEIESIVNLIGFRDTMPYTLDTL